MMRKTRIIFLGVVLSALLCNSCIDKQYDINKLQTKELLFDPALGAPLLYSSAMTVKQTLMRAFGKDIIGEDADHLVYFRYENLKVPIDTSVAKIRIPFPADYGVPILQDILSNDAGWEMVNGKPSIKKIGTLTFPFPAGYVITSAVLNTILHNIKLITSNYPTSGTLTITFSSFMKNGVPYSKDIAINQPYSFSTMTPFTVDDYTMNFSPGNTLPVTYIYTLNSGSTPLAAGNTLSIHHYFTNIVGSKDLSYKFLFGDFGKKDLFVSDTITIPIALFKEAKGMNFDDPKVTLGATSSFGMPLKIAFSNIAFISSTGAEKPITIPDPLGNVLTVRAAPDLNDSISDELILTNTNTNNSLTNAMNSQPSKMTYKVKVTTDGVAGSKQWVKSNSSAIVNFGVVFPLSGYCEKFPIIDTVGFDYGELFGNAQSLGFKIWVNNGLPTNATISLSMLDENNQFIDAITVTDSIVAPAIASDGKVSGTQERTIWMEYEHLENLSKIKKLAIAVIFYTPEFDKKKSVKIYSDNTFQMKIGVRVKMAYKYKLD